MKFNLLKYIHKIDEKTHRLLNIIFLIAFMLVLEYVYRHLIVVRYPHLGFSYDFHLLKYLETKLILLAGLGFSFLIPSKKDFLYFISNVVIALMLIPNLIIYEFLIERQIISYLILAFVAILFLFSKVKYTFQYDKLALPEKYRVPVLGVLVMALLIPFMIIYGFDFNWKIFILKDVYEVRDLFKQASILWTDYTYSPLGKVLIPVLIVFSLRKRNYVFLTVALIGMIYLYLIGAHKILLFGLFLVFFIYLFRDYFALTTGFVGALLLIVIVGYIAYLFGFEDIESLFTRRFLFYPALYNEYYFEFFQNNHIHLSHSVLEPFFEYPYDLNPSYKISEVFKDNPAQSCNNGFLSSGYMNFGVAGVLGNIVFLGILFRFFNDLKMHPSFASVFIIMFYTLMSSELMTSLFTHGIILLIFVSWFILSNTQYRTN